MVVADRFRTADTPLEVWRALAALSLLDALVTVAGLGWTWTVPAARSIFPQGLWCRP